MSNIRRLRKRFIKIIVLIKVYIPFRLCLFIISYAKLNHFFFCLTYNTESIALLVEIHFFVIRKRIKNQEKNLCQNTLSSDIKLLWFTTRQRKWHIISSCISYFLFSSFVQMKLDIRGSIKNAWGKKNCSIIIGYKRSETTTWTSVNSWRFYWNRTWNA
jgi:hypothetical protein